MSDANAVMSSSTLSSPPISVSPSTSRVPSITVLPFVALTVNLLLTSKLPLTSRVPVIWAPALSASILVVVPLISFILLALLISRTPVSLSI